MKKVLYFVAMLFSIMWIILWNAACKAAVVGYGIEQAEECYPRIMKKSMKIALGKE